MPRGKFIHQVPIFQYRVDFSDAYEAADSPSVLSISKATEISRPTIAGFVQKGGVTVNHVSNAVVVLAAYLGVNWKDYVSAEEITEDGDITPESERSLLTA